MSVERWHETVLALESTSAHPMALCHAASSHDVMVYLVSTIASMPAFLAQLLRPGGFVQGVVKRFFNEKEVTSTLVMDALVSGVKQIEESSRLGESKKVSCLSYQEGNAALSFLQFLSEHHHPTQTAYQQVNDSTVHSDADI